MSARTAHRPVLRLGTRGSRLALWQARHVAARLAPFADVQLVPIRTRGDRLTTVPLTAVDGRAFFTAEIEQALLDERVDLAVHSHKDLATESPPRLVVAAVTARHAPHERLLVAPAAHAPEQPWLPLRPGAAVGTDAPRRAAQLLALRPDLAVRSVRGNVPTRVDKLRAGAFDAIVLAAAGLERLGLDLSDLVVVRLPLGLVVPAPAQGALAVQTRADDDVARALCAEHLHDRDCAAQVAAERSLLAAAGGGCRAALGVHVERLAGLAGAAAAAGGIAPAVWRALAFVGADRPVDGAPARWAEARGGSPAEAAHAVWELLRSGEPTGQGPLAGLHAVLVGSEETGASHLARRLSTLGARVACDAVLRFEELDAPELAAQLARLGAGDVVAVTSRRAAHRLRGLALPAGVRLAAVGPATAEALRAAGHVAAVVGDGGAAGLAARLGLRPGATVLFPCAAEARPELPAALSAAGARVVPVVVYRTVAAAPGGDTPGGDAPGGDANGALAQARARSGGTPAGPPRADGALRIYTSPSAVRASVALGREAAHATRRLALGATTAEALAAAGLVHEAPAGSGVEAVLAHLAARRPLVPETSP